MGAAWAQLNLNRFRDCRVLPVGVVGVPLSIYSELVCRVRRGLLSRMFGHGFLGTEIDRNREDSKMSITQMDPEGED